MQQMRALVKAGSQTRLRRVPVPQPAASEVRVRVELAGLCRTDVQVAQGQLPSIDPVILGHEFAGVLDALGTQVTRLRFGQRVAVLPVLACACCPVCAAGDTINCPQRTMLGVDRDGAFAEFVCVPAPSVYPIPDHLDSRLAAYAEPVAAALAVLTAGIRPEQRGLILGRNRFARLVERLLRLHGIGNLETEASRESTASWLPDSFDFVIETALNDACLAAMIQAARPRGTLLIKSRRPGTVALPVLPLLRKQLTLRAVNYGCFRTALRLLAEGQLDVRDLLGPIEPLETFESVFAQAARDETAKVFFDPSRAHVRHPG